jgi:glycyl-tRNA synthetase beta chain
MQKITEKSSKLLSELLIEIYSLEIPARMQIKIEDIFIPIFSKVFNEHRIIFEEIKILSCPSRVTIYITNIKNSVDAISIETKGPKADADKNIVEKFCNSKNINKDKLVIRTIKDQEFYFYLEEIPQKYTTEVLKVSIPKALADIVWPKSMFWGESKINWVRPIQNIMCIYDEDVLRFNYGGFESNNYTFGHKFMSNGEKIFVKNIDEYKQNLKNNFCIVDRGERIDIIRSQIKEICIKNNLSTEIDEDLLKEVVGLVDFPNTLIGNIKDEFMKIPHEIVIVAMKNHQRYFSCKNLDGTTSNKFIFVSNIKTNNDNLIVEGNQKVLSSRLRDALYFYNQDIKDSFEAKFDNLKKLIFHQKLGSIKDKAQRLIDVSKNCEIEKNYKNKEKLIIASKLCKIDLLSEAVGEFPELQGVMGKYYAINEGFDEEIALAIEEHYIPRSAGDSVPKNDLSIKLSLLDKIDSVVGLFFAGERPTGSKDPYALRRLAISIIRIILENKIENFEMQNVISEFVCKFIDSGRPEERRLLESDVTSFIEERLKKYDEK